MTCSCITRDMGCGNDPPHNAPAQSRCRSFPLSPLMKRALPIVERELRKFIRTPVLLVMTLFMPVLNLVVLGNAFGGRVRHLNVAVVDEDGGDREQDQGLGRAPARLVGV